MKFTLAPLALFAMAATVNAAMIKDKRLFPAPAPTIPAGLEATDSGCFDAGDCFAYQYPSFQAQCIQGKCYKPIKQSNPFGLPTLPSFGLPGATPTATA
ncbi:unnamed protein product [Sympodiomycopsis kandeliae]